MLGVTNFTAFVVACMLMNMTPGSDTMYILGRSLSQGRNAGLLSALGISVGCLIHTMLAGFGLSLIVAKSELIFNTIKYLGALYLAYLGIQMIVSARDRLTIDEQKTTKKRIFLSGVLTNILNPKVAIFFMAFLPQFVDASQVNSPIPFLLLGGTFTITGTLWCIGLALFAARLSGKIRNNPSIKKWLDISTGSLFIALGLRLALQSRT